MDYNGISSAILSKGSDLKHPNVWDHDELVRIYGGKNITIFSQLYFGAKYKMTFDQN